MEDRSKMADGGSVALKRTKTAAYKRESYNQRAIPWVSKRRRVCVMQIASGSNLTLSTTFCQYTLLYEFALLFCPLLFYSTQKPTKTGK